MEIEKNGNYRLVVTGLRPGTTDDIDAKVINYKIKFYFWTVERSMSDILVDICILVLAANGIAIMLLILGIKTVINNFYLRRKEDLDE